MSHNEHGDACVNAFEHSIVPAVCEAPARCLAKGHQPGFRTCAQEARSRTYRVLQDSELRNPARDMRT